MSVFVWHCPVKKLINLSPDWNYFFTGIAVRQFALGILWRVKP